MYRVVIKIIDGVRKRQLNLSNQLLTLPFLLQTLVFYFEYETEVFSLQYFVLTRKGNEFSCFIVFVSTHLIRLLELLEPMSTIGYSTFALV